MRISGQTNLRLHFCVFVALTIGLMLAGTRSPRELRTSTQPLGGTGPWRNDSSTLVTDARTSRHQESYSKGRKGLLSALYGNIGKHRVFTMAGGITFYSIIALFPAMAALVAIYSLFANPETIRQTLDELGGILPGGALQVLGDELHRACVAEGQDTWVRVYNWFCRRVVERQFGDKGAARCSQSCL